MADLVGRKKLGTQGLEVSELGLGCMGFSGNYKTEDIVREENAFNVIDHAFKKGVTFFDTADMYGPHTNEILLGKALKALPREEIQIATKFAMVFEEGKLRVRGDPAYVRQACETSLKRLDVDYIDLYYQHRVDRETPIEATMGELKKLVEEGKVKYIGLSEAAPDTIRRAHAVHPISAIQIEWALWVRDVEDQIIPLCRELGIGIVPYGSLGHGFFSGKGSVEALHEKDGRREIVPRFKDENLQKNMVLYERVAALAKKHGCSPGQLALAWVSSQGEDVVPIPGTTKLANLDENLASLNVKLSPSELEELAAAVPMNEVAGDRSSSTANLWPNAITPPLESWTRKTNA
ncbi:unnamed protein product [Calypogeia fissa]